MDSVETTLKWEDQFLEMDQLTNSSSDDEHLLQDHLARVSERNVIENYSSIRRQDVDRSLKPWKINDKLFIFLSLSLVLHLIRSETGFSLKLKCVEQKIRWADWERFHSIRMKGRRPSRCLFSDIVYSPHSHPFTVTKQTNLVMIWRWNLMKNFHREFDRVIDDGKSEANEKFLSQRKIKRCYENHFSTNADRSTARRDIQRHLIQ